MSLKTGMITFTDTTTIVELCTLTNGTLQSVTWQGIGGMPSFALYTTADGAGGSYPMTPALGWALMQGQPLAGVTGTIYAQCTDLGGEPSQPVSYLAWDAS